MQGHSSGIFKVILEKSFLNMYPATGMEKHQNCLSSYMKRLFVTGSLALVVCFCTAAYANVELEFDVHSNKIRQTRKEKKEEAGDSSLKVVLGKDYFSFSQGERQEIYDFVKRRVFLIDQQRKIYEDESLFYNIGFRSLEMQNRLAMEASFKAATVKGLSMDSSLAEHLFSITGKDSRLKMTETKGEGTISFETDDKELMSWSLEAIDVTKTEMHQFIKFFRYHFGGHPSILKKLEAFGRIPKSIKITVYDIGSKETSLLTLASVSKTSETPYDIDDLKPGILPDDKDELSKIIYRVRFENPNLYQQRANDVLKAAEDDFSKKKYFESFLGYMEYGFQTGKTSESLVQKKGILQTDENVNKYLAADAAFPKGRSLVTFQQLRNFTEGHKHIIMTMEGDIQASIGNVDEAKRLLLAALEVNPYLAGVYMDLGKVYYMQYNTLQAWRCWDLGRKLAPASKAGKLDTGKETDNLEKNLVRDYGDFF